MVTDPTGAIGTVLELPDHAAKKGSGRVIPLHEDLRTALAAWRGSTQAAGPVIASERGGPMTPQSIVVWFNRAYQYLGLDGCSSHSGRRTFITRAARLRSRRVPARRAAIGWSPLVSNYAAIHRRRHRCPAQARLDDLMHVADLARTGRLTDIARSVGVSANCREGHGRRRRPLLMKLNVDAILLHIG
jgi:integrase